MSPTERKTIYTLLVLGGLFRLLYTLYLHPPESALVSDMLAYRDVALLEAQGIDKPFVAAWHCFSTHLLAFCFRYLGGPAPYAYLQCAAAIASLLLGARLAVKTLPGRWAVVCTGVLAFDFISVSFAGNYMGETFAQFFLLVTVSLLLKWQEKESLLYLVPAGIALGLAGMSREYLLLTAPGMALWVVYKQPGKVTKKLLAVALLAGCSVVALSPQIARNATLTGNYDLGMSRGARNLAYGWSRGKTQISLASEAAWCSPIYSYGALTAPFDFAEDLHAPPTEDKPYWFSVLKTQIRQNPKIVFQKLLHPLYGWIIPAWPAHDCTGWMGWGVNTSHFLLLLIAFPLYLVQLGDCSRKGSSAILLLNLTVIGYWATTYLGHGQSSYKVPFHPVFWILAFNGVGYLAQHRKKCVVGLVAFYLVLGSLCLSMRPTPLPPPLYPFSVEKGVLSVGGHPIRAVGQSVTPLVEHLQPAIAEWSLEAYPHAWHYRTQEQRLRIDVDRNQRIEGFQLQKAENPRYFPPDQKYRWNSKSW